jgi:hypothetical protein
VGTKGVTRHVGAAVGEKKMADYASLIRPTGYAVEASMRMTLLLLTLSMFATSPCLALTQQAADFIKSIGLDPKSADVVAADKDGVIKSTYRGDPVAHSLESLAKEKKVNAVKSFVVSRKIARALNTNFKGYKLPNGGIEHYDGLYLTQKERLLMANKIVERR